MMRKRIRRSLVAFFGVVVFLGVAATPAFAANVRLGSGQTLNAGQSINTGTGCYLIVQATDGNVVEYCNGAAHWNAETQPHPGDRLAMQTDGNLVVYTGSSWLFQTGTNGYSGAYLQLQDDQNLVVYQGSTALWAVSWVHSASGAQTYSQKLFIHYGWSVGTQYPCLNNLWQRESGWNWNATNPSSGTYGIPQSLPTNKMAAAGTDWHDDGLTQVQWGENYISGRYGNPCAAWAHEQQFGWY